MQNAYELLEGGMDLIIDADKLMSDLLSYPFHDTLSMLLAELSRVGSETAGGLPGLCFLINYKCISDNTLIGIS